MIGDVIGKIVLASFALLVAYAIVAMLFKGGWEK